MAANLITVGRIILAFLVVLMFQGGFVLRVAAVAMTIVVIWLDSLDGYVARKLKVASEVGALFDITGDRIVEHIYLIFYAAMGVLSFWVPMIFVTRSFLVDTLRAVAFSKEGKTPFGDSTMMRSPFTRFLTASRFSRAVYGVAKVVVFVFLGLCLAFRQALADGASWLAPSFLQAFGKATLALVWVMVAFNLLRGLPVLYDGRIYLFERTMPRQLKRDA